MPCIKGKDLRPEIRERIIENNRFRKKENYKIILDKRKKKNETQMIYLNHFPQIDSFCHLCSRRIFKTLWQKEKLLTMYSTLFYNLTSFIEQFHIFALIISKSSAADLLYVGEA